jgi:hypothetical protein
VASQGHRRWKQHGVSSLYSLYSARGDAAEHSANKELARRANGRCDTRDKRVDVEVSRKDQQGEAEQKKSSHSSREAAKTYQRSRWITPKECLGSMGFQY